MKIIFNPLNPGNFGKIPAGMRPTPLSLLLGDFFIHKNIDTDRKKIILKTSVTDRLSSLKTENLRAFKRFRLVGSAKALTPIAPIMDLDRSVGTANRGLFYI